MQVKKLHFALVSIGSVPMLRASSETKRHCPMKALPERKDLCLISNMLHLPKTSKTNADTAVKNVLNHLHKKKKAKYKNIVDTNGLKETLSQKLVFHSTGPTSGQQPAQKMSCIIHDLGHL